MNQQKILITGAFGQLGRALTLALKNSHELILTDSNIPSRGRGFVLDISDRSFVKDSLSAFEPDLIINLGAITNVDACEENSDRAWIVNSTSVQNLLDFGKCPLIHLSTDYVFDGENGPYKEEDEPNPINIYGETKLESEERIWATGEKHLVIRTNVVYDYAPQTQASFLKWVVESLKNKQNISVVNDQYNNPTWTNSLAEVIKRCIEQEVRGLAHWGDEDYLNRYEFALKIAKQFGLDQKLIQKISTDSLDQLAPRPLKGGLDASKLSKAIDLKAPSLNESLHIIKKRFKE